jgi:hypothetical protein
MAHKGEGQNVVGLSRAKDGTDGTKTSPSGFLTKKMFHWTIECPKLIFRSPRSIRPNYTVA